MAKKIIIILEIVFVIIALGYYTIKVLIPEYRDTHGSSDPFMKTKEYQNMVEIKVDDSIHFALAMNREKQIFYIFFFSKNASCLYNQNIEGMDLDEGILKVIQILIQSDYLKNNSIIQFTRYNDQYYKEFLQSFQNHLEEYEIPPHIGEGSSTLELLCERLHITPQKNEKTLLRNIDFYSKEYIRQYRNDLDSYTEGEDLGIIDSSNARNYADNVYVSVSRFFVELHVGEVKKNDSRLDITTIPAGEKSIYYPTSNSWYYIEEGKLYAYIEFEHLSEIYSYCYHGSLQNVTEGECS